ncbi:hypothetical protein [Pararhodospirillum photometricum]|nr:hypothetical protein [Pararhodospirillum photometricum]
MTHPLPPKTTSRWLLAAGLAAVACTASLGSAYADDLNTRPDARTAIARAEAKIELVSRESPAATQYPSFSMAQEKLKEARAASARGNDQQAQWRASEAELLADTTAGTSRLSSLERIRTETSHSIKMLTSEHK